MIPKFLFSPRRLPRLAVMTLVAMAVQTSGRCYAAMPNAALTPGDVAEHDTSKVCSVRNAERHRSVSYRMRDSVYLAYGIPRGRRKGLYRIDHLIPLELGGSNRVTNLWPQPYADSKVKDHIEDVLHEAVCSGSMSLDAAQRAISRDWHTAVPPDLRR